MPRDASDGEDSDFSDIEDEFEGDWRAKRLEELKAAAEKATAMREEHHGSLTEFKDEKELMLKVAKTKKAVVHFYHPDFQRCAIMDKHLEQLAAKHFDTLFFKINVAFTPFLVTKFAVQVLPCVMAFVNGNVKDKITGFEGLNKSGVDGDNFKTADLEFRLCLSGAIPKSQIQDQAGLQEALQPK